MGTLRERTEIFLLLGMENGENVSQGRGVGMSDVRLLQNSPVHWIPKELEIALIGVLLPVIAGRQIVVLGNISIM